MSFWRGFHFLRTEACVTDSRCLQVLGHGQVNINHLVLGCVCAMSMRGGFDPHPCAGHLPPQARFWILFSSKVSALRLALARCPLMFLTCSCVCLALHAHLCSLACRAGRNYEGLFSSTCIWRVFLRLSKLMEFVSATVGESAVACVLFSWFGAQHI